VLRAARRALAGSGAWVVGGAVRDAALARDVSDVDLAVSEGAEEDAARSIAGSVGGHAFSLSEQFATWRVTSQDAGWRLDLAPVRGGGIEADLGMRDFTVNAMGLALGPAADRDAALIDPCGGLADLDAGLLRAVSERSFVDDPLRFLRGARLGAALDLELDPATRRLARNDAARAADPAGERIFAELRGIVGGPAPLRGLELLDALGATPALLPELEQLRGITQTPYHHLDAHGHSLEVLERFVELQVDLPAVVGVELADEIAGTLDRGLADEMTRGDALRFAALLHDIGKPGTRAVTAEDRVTFMGHDKLGAEMTRGLCARLRTSGRFADFLASVTSNHLRLGFLVHAQPLSRRTVFDYLRATEPYGVDVTVLTIADRLATHGGKTRPAAIEAHLELAREMLAEVLAWDRVGAPRAPIRGDELAAELGIEPGPALGRLLGEVEAAVFAGEVRSRDDAVKLAAAKAAAP
jgi:putative nucleotidyltransferase with HDIG domain